jgi:glycosyltransferase involved in cell wall biosynthesis
MVFHPPLTSERHTVDATGGHVTLVNLNEHKGALIFYELARRMPHTKFLGVVGGHGNQIIRRNIPNVTIMDHGPDMKRVWTQTRVLLMPSVYESYGLVAVEAGINGIPTVANPTPGLLENLGRLGIFVERDGPIEHWVTALNDLLVPEVYSVASDYARSRATLALDSTRHALKQWCDWLG